MKKLIALLLAVLMLASLVACGESPAPAAEAPAAEAPAAAETPAAETPAAPEAAAPDLRPGDAVEVYNAEDFRTAYLNALDPNGTVNTIRICADISVVDKIDVLPEGTDLTNVPYLTDVFYLCVRMPEGTAIDLNGFRLTLRGIQGMDSSVGGVRSDKYTLGTVVDSYGGGSICLYAWKDSDHLLTACKVAEQYPGIVNQINITKFLSDSENVDFVIPENVKLTMSNENAYIVANSITFKSGATCKIGEKSNGLTGTKAIIFECKNENDHSREGIELATEVKDV